MYFSVKRHRNMIIQQGTHTKFINIRLINLFVEIFQLQDNLVKINEERFPSESSIQKLVEENLDVLFSDVEFVDTEVKMGDTRFDTLAFNPQQKSFVIIEYKKGRKDAFSQGLSYLYKLNEMKDRAILIYQKKKKRLLDGDDIKWDKTRIIFIAPEFTKHQKDANKISKDNIELYEINRYQNKIITLNKLGDSPPRPLLPIDDGKRPPVSEEDYLERMYGDSTTHNPIRDLWRELRKKINESFPDMKYVQKKVSGRYKINDNVVCSLQAFKNCIYLSYSTQGKSLLGESVEYVIHGGKHQSMAKIKDMQDIKKALLDLMHN